MNARATTSRPNREQSRGLWSVLSSAASLTLRAVEFGFYHLLITTVNRLLRLPRDTTKPDAVRLHRERIVAPLLPRSAQGLDFVRPGWSSAAYPTPATSPAPRFATGSPRASRIRGSSAASCARRPARAAFASWSRSRRPRVVLRTHDALVETHLDVDLGRDDVQDIKARVADRGHLGPEKQADAQLVRHLVVLLHTLEVRRRRGPALVATRAALRLALGPGRFHRQYHSEVYQRQPALEALEHLGARPPAPQDGELLGELAVDLAH